MASNYFSREPPREPQRHPQQFQDPRKTAINANSTLGKLLPG